jgi:hypothetical protein
VRNCSVHLYAVDLQLYFVDIDKNGLTNMVACVNDDLVFGKLFGPKIG